MNLMNVDGYHAKIDYDEEMDQFRGEILGLSGGADFYGSSPEELRQEFKKSFFDLQLHLERKPSEISLNIIYSPKLLPSHAQFGGRRYIFSF